MWYIKEKEGGVTSQFLTWATRRKKLAANWDIKGMEGIVLEEKDRFELWIYEGQDDH